LRADPADVDGSHDYPGFERPPGFAISDYTEDNPATFDFPVARPTPTDAFNLETIHAEGHRYIIRYEIKPDATPPSIWQMQSYYEKLAAAQGFVTEKNGAGEDINETFHKTAGKHSVWVYLEPGTSANLLTVLEFGGTPAAPLAESTAPALTPAATTDTTRAPAAEDPLYLTLMKEGRVILPLVFAPNKADLGDEATPLITRVVNILRAHPELHLHIEGHTDNRGSSRENVRISSERAHAVRSLIVARGISRKRLMAVGLGAADPIAENTTSDGRAQNRRIELVRAMP